MTQEQRERLKIIIKRVGRWTANDLEDFMELSRPNNFLSLLAQLDRYEEALKWYANRTNWTIAEDNMEDDCGSRARTALSHLKDES